MRDTGEGETVQATKTSFTIVEELSERRGAGVTELATALDFPKSTVHKHLRTLASIGYVKKSRTEYYLTEKFDKIDQGSDAPVDKLEMIRSEADKLANLLDELAGLYIKNGTTGRDIYRSQQTIDGEEFTNAKYLHATAPGKAILSRMSEDEVGSVIDKHGLEPLTQDTIVGEANLFEELELVRERGIAFEREEQAPSLRSVATPVTRENGDVIGALYVAGSSDRFTGKQFVEHIPGMLLNAENTIEIATLHKDQQTPG